MYSPTTRLLTILELLQSHNTLSGDAIAQRLEVEPRSVRRYILMLQDMGMPIEAIRGPGGGYRLRPGFKLPPLMLTEEEATAVVLGLLGSAWLEIGLSSLAVEGALAKISRVLPVRARERLQAVSANLTLWTPGKTTQPDAALLLKLSEAIQRQQRVALAYRAQNGEITARDVEPYGISGWRGHWYLIGYCCLRHGYRVFRLDRMQRALLLDQDFVKDEAFDYRTYMQEHYVNSSPRWSVAIEFAATLATVQEKIPSAFGTFSETPAGVLFEAEYEDLADMARYLTTLNLAFVIHQPQELRDALLALSEQIRRIATATT